jgi:hypothetical protein
VAFEFGQATTASEIEAVQQLRYAVYVEELDRYHDVQGGDEHRFVEPEDAHSWLFYAREGDTIVAATRMTCGADGISRTSCRSISRWGNGPTRRRAQHDHRVRSRRWNATCVTSPRYTRRSDAGSGVGQSAEPALLPVMRFVVSR